MRTTTLMRAIVYSHGASADVLKLEEIDKPLPGERRFRAVRVSAVALNSPANNLREIDARYGGNSVARIQSN